MGIIIHTNTSQSRFKLFIICLNILFGFSVYEVLIFNVLKVRIPGHTLVLGYGSTMLYAFMTWLGIKELAQAKDYPNIVNKPIVKFAINAYVIIYLIMAVQIPWNVLSAKTVVTKDVVVWLLPVVAVFGLKEENWNTMLKIFRWQTAIGCFALLFAMPVITREALFIDPFRQRLNLGEICGGILGGSNQLMYANTFLLLSFGSLNIVWRIITLAMAGMTIWISLIGQFRSGVLFVVLAAAIGVIYIPMRAFTSNRRQGKWRPLNWIMIPLTLFIIGALFTGERFEMLRYKFSGFFQYFDKLQTRMEYVMTGTNSESGLDVRIEESRQALSEQNLMQLIFGKGMGATWSGGTLYGERRWMLHLGLGHLMLRGGVPLALFGLIFPFAIGTYLLFRSSSQVVLVCSGLIAVYFVQIFAANIFDLNLNYLIFLLCAGGCLLHFQRKSPQPNKG